MNLSNITLLIKSPYTVCPFHTWHQLYPSILSYIPELDKSIFHRSELDRKFDNTELTLGVFVRSQTETETVWSKMHLVERRGGEWRWREERGSWMRQRPEDRDEWLWMWMCGQSAGKQAGERSWSATKTRISYGVSASVTERLQQCC